MHSSHGEDQFKPNTTVAAVIHCAGKFLLVEEYEFYESGRKRVLNQPAGHLERDEDIITACEREVHEETGLSLSPDYVNGIYYFYREDIDLYYLRFCFVFELNECITSIPLDDEILTTKWLSYSEIIASSNSLRSELVLQCIDDYIENKSKGVKILLSSLQSNI